MYDFLYLNKCKVTSNYSGQIHGKWSKKVIMFLIYGHVEELNKITQR